MEKRHQNGAAVIYPSSVLITTGLWNLWTQAQSLMLLISLKQRSDQVKFDFSFNIILYPTCRRFVFTDYYKQKADTLKCRAESNHIMMRCLMNDFCNTMTAALLLFSVLILIIIQCLILTVSRFLNVIISFKRCLFYQQLQCIAKDYKGFSL